MDGTEVKVGDELVVVNSDFSHACNGSRCIVMDKDDDSRNCCVVRWVRSAPLLINLLNGQSDGRINVSPMALYRRNHVVVFEPHDRDIWFTPDYRAIDSGMFNGVTIDVTFTSQICASIHSNIMMLNGCHVYGKNYVDMNDVIKVIVGIDKKWAETLIKKRLEKKEIPFPF